MDAYSYPVAKLTRSGKCDCRICHIAKRQGRPKSKVQKATQEMKHLCKRCSAEIYRGSGHSMSACNSRRSLLANALQVLQDQGIEEQVAASVINKKVQVDGSCTLRTMGKPMHVAVGPKSTSSSSHLNADEVHLIQNDAHLSDRQVLVVLKHLRQKLGRSIVEPHIRDLMGRRKRIFGDLFEVRQRTFQEGSEERSTAFVVCSGENTWVTFMKCL